MSLLKVNEVQNYNGSSLTLTASTVSTSAQLNTGGNISVTGSINVSDDSTTRSNLGLGTMATQNANAVAITGGTINTVQPATGQSLTIKDEDGNTAITVGTDNTATGYLSLNFGSYHGDSGGAGSGTLTGNTLSDYEEGSFDPEFSSSGTLPNVSSYGFREGFYVKIGSMVHFSLRMRAHISSVGTGNAYIAGLPFSASSDTGYTAAVSVGYTENWTTISPQFAQVTSGNSYLSLYNGGGATKTGILTSNYKTGNASYNEIYIAGTYRTN